MFDISLKGVDPQLVSDIVKRVDSTTKRVDWLSAAAVSIVKQLATKFHLDLPPDVS